MIDVHRTLRPLLGREKVGKAMKPIINDRNNDSGPVSSLSTQTINYGETSNMQTLLIMLGQHKLKSPQ